jgi:hypothetical protein
MGASTLKVGMENLTRAAPGFTAGVSNLKWREQTTAGASMWSPWTNIQSGAATSDASITASPAPHHLH